MRGGSLKCLVARFVTRIRGFSFEVEDRRSPRESASIFRVSASMGQPDSGREIPGSVGGLSERERASIRRVNASIEYAGSGSGGQGMVVDVLRQLLTRMSGRSLEGRGGLSRTRAVIFAIEISNVGSGACSFRGCGSK
jgi:hypothetical protein